MRDSVLFYLNGKPFCVGGASVFTPLSDFLRYEQQATGTKVVCAEGDCGACTVLLGRVKNGALQYLPLNSCIQYLYQLDGAHIITVEGLQINGALNPVQEAMVANQGAQCGYCTPGFIVAMSSQAMACQSSQASLCQQGVKDALTGNLCRCTGYEPIIKAALALEPGAMPTLETLYPSAEMVKAFQEIQNESILIEADGRTYFNPVTLEELVAFKAQHPNTTLVAGGTDINVVCNKRDVEPPVIVSLSNLPNLDSITLTENGLMAGAKVLLSELEQALAERVPEFHDILVVFGSPQIKNAGTLAGNIANGSPIGDSIPFLMAMDAQVEVQGQYGARKINMNNLYTGYRQLDLKPDELITRIHIPLPQPDEHLKLYKISKRKHLDISSFTAAVRMRLRGESIDEIRLVYGGVGPVVLRLTKTEAFLLGKPFTLETMESAGTLARQEIAPLSDVRGSKEYRLQLAENILQKFYYDVADAVHSKPVGAYS